MFPKAASCYAVKVHKTVAHWSHEVVSVHGNGRFCGRETKNQYPIHKNGPKRGRDEETKRQHTQFVFSVCDGQNIVIWNLAIMEQLLQNIFCFYQHMHIISIILPVLDGILV